MNPEGEPLTISLLKGHRKTLDNLSSLRKQPFLVCTHDGTHTGMLCYPESRSLRRLKSQVVVNSQAHPWPEGNQIYLEVELGTSLASCPHGLCLTPPVAFSMKKFHEVPGKW